MAAALCSPTAYVQVNNSDGSYSGSVTVPADCDFVVMIFLGYATATRSVSACTLGGTAMTARLSVGTANTTCRWIYVLPAPPTGSQTFVINHNGSFAAGGTAFLVWCKGIHQTTYERDIESQYGSSSATTQTFNHTSQPGDLGIIAGGGDSGTAYNVDLESQTKLIETSAYNNGLCGLAYKMASGTTLTMSGYGAFNGVASIVLIPAANTYSETATDGIKAGEAISRISTMRSAITDGFSGGESMARRSNMISASSDGAKLSETLARIVSGSRAATDGVIAAEALSMILTFGKSATDGIKISDQALSIATLSLTATDGAALGDSAARRLDLLAAISDGCKLSELLATALLLSKSITDGAKFSEEILSDLSGILEEAISDGFRAGDSLSSTAQFIRSVSDQFNLSEALAGILSASKLIADGVILSDSTIGEILANIFQEILSDGFKFSESTQTVAHFDITVTDGAKFSETIATIMSMLSAIAEGLNLGDSATITTEATLASGRVTITFTGRAGGRIVFTVRKPSITFSVN